MRTHAVYRVAAAAVFVLAATAASAAVTSVDLGGATLTGAPNIASYLSGDDKAPYTTIDLSQIAVTSSGGQVSFAFDPGIDDFYYGGYRPDYRSSIYGTMAFPQGFSVTANDGYALDLSQSGYRITGQVSVTDEASVRLSTGQLYIGKGVRSVPDVYTFTADVKQAGGSSYLLSWDGTNPYGQGPNGTAAVFSEADIKITKIEYYVGIAAVPEAGTSVLMLVGLAGLVAARRRHT